MDVLGWLGFRRSEKRVYNALSKNKKGMRIKDISRETGMSERAIRETVKKLIEKKFVKRKVIKGKRLMYVYIALPVKTAWDRFRESVDKVISMIK